MSARVSPVHQSRGHSRGQRVWLHQRPGFRRRPDYNQIRNVPIGTGRWFNDHDNTEQRRVAVVGMGTVEEIFRTSRRGRTILLNGVRFDVVGVVPRSDKTATTAPTPASSSRRDHA